MLFLPRLNVSKKSESSPSWKGGTYRPTSPAEARVLELDHLCTEVRELEGAPRPGAELLDGEHADVGERQAHRPDAAGRRAAFHAFS